MYSTAMDIDGSNGAYAGKLGAGMVDAVHFMECVHESADEPPQEPRKPTAKPTPIDDEPRKPTAKPTPGSDKPCCVDPTGECQHMWWNGQLQTQDRCEAFHDGLCEWICDDDEPRKPTAKPTPGNEKPCCVDPSGECQHQWFNGFLQTQDRCEAFHDGLCEWICDDDEWQQDDD